jgi:hypothetical protein
MDVQRKLEILADANPARGIPSESAAVVFSATTAPRRICSTARG